MTLTPQTAVLVDGHHHATYIADDIDNERLAVIEMSRHGRLPERVRIPTRRLTLVDTQRPPAGLDPAWLARRLAMDAPPGRSPDRERLERVRVAVRARMHTAVTAGDDDLYGTLIGILTIIDGGTS